jgi:hypothetical protein
MTHVRCARAVGDALATVRAPSALSSLLLLPLTPEQKTVNHDNPIATATAITQSTMARRSSRLAKFDDGDPPDFLDLDVVEEARKRKRKEQAEEARKKQRVDFREPTSSANRMIQDAIANSDVLRDQRVRLFRNSQLEARLSDDDPRNEM